MSEKKSPLRVTTRGKIAIGGTALALFGLGVTVGETTSIKWPEGHTYTKKELDNFPKQAVTVPAGSGANEVVRSVESALGNDTQGFMDVRDFVTNQGTLEKDGHHMLQQGQQVLVPLIPGILHNIDK